MSYEEEGKMYVKYEVIGENHVAVPTRFFKVIFTNAEAGLKSLAAFILPNKEMLDRHSIDEFLTAVDKVERAAGFLFLQSTFLEKLNIEENICYYLNSDSILYLGGFQINLVK
ncbi:MAG: hypothetical protein HKM07_02235 [Chlamydiae bacterium]|nr:hypothetical protein [Chlamydiota bacterium]